MFQIFFSTLSSFLLQTTAEKDHYNSDFICWQMKQILKYPHMKSTTNVTKAIIIKLIWEFKEKSERLPIHFGKKFIRIPLSETG